MITPSNTKTISHCLDKPTCWSGEAQYSEKRERLDAVQALSVAEHRFSTISDTDMKHSILCTAMQKSNPIPGRHSTSYYYVDAQYLCTNSIYLNHCNLQKKIVKEPMTFWNIINKIMEYFTQISLFHWRCCYIYFTSLSEAKCNLIKIC